MALIDYGVSYSLALQKSIGEVKRAVKKYDRAHDDAHTVTDWTRMLNQRAQVLHQLANLSPPFNSEEFEAELLALIAIGVSALAHHEREKGRNRW